jgi:hypothetical protein
MKRSISLGLFLALLCIPALVRSDEKPARLPLAKESLEKLLRTDYYGAYMLGKKIGWAKMSLVRLREAQGGGYASQVEMNMKIISLGAKIETTGTSSEEFDAKPPYAFRGGFSRETDGQSVKEIKLTRTAKGFDVSIQTGDEKTRKQIGPLDYTLEDATTDYVWVMRGPKIGDTVTTRSFDLDDLTMHRNSTKLLATKQAIAGGVKVVYHELEVTTSKDGLTGLARIDKGGEKLISMKIAGIVELRLEPEKLAKNTEFSADLFLLGLAKLDRKLGAESALTSLVLETVGTQDLGLKSGPRQTVSRNASGTYTIKLGKAHGIPARATEQEIADNLAETATYPVGNAKIQALAKEAVGDATTAEEKIKRLVGFVSGYISPSYTTSPFTVMDIVKVRKGSCTHYAALFTTLARAAGIPARELGGLIALGDGGTSLGFHAWNEVVVDGHWQPIDATANETEINPTHISFGSSAGDQVTNMFTAFGKLSFRVVDKETRK